MRAIRRFTINPVLPEQLAPLRGLMLNLRWSWHAETRAVFASIDPAAWARAGGDPAGLLAGVSQERLTRLAADRKFLRGLDDAADDLRDYLAGPRWYQDAGEDITAGGPPRWRTSHPSTGSPRRCRSTPAGWASWPAIT